MKKLKQNGLNFIVIFIFSFFIPLPINASTCHGHQINPLTDICWRCLFPITIGSTTVAKGDLPDTDNPNNPICSCQYGYYRFYGYSEGFWEPIGLVDVTRTPYCQVNFGGQQKTGNVQQSEGSVDTQSPDQNGSFYYVHYYPFPVLRWIGAGWLLGGACEIEGDASMPYFSELDPTWHDSELTNLAFPETAMFSNPVSAVAANIACGADALAANTGLASDALFWCMGSQGLTYPLNGHVAEQVSVAQASTLLAERAVFKLHRFGLIQDTSPHELCYPTPMPIMPKSRYRYQMVYPSVDSCHPFGRSTMLWSTGKINPMEGDDTGYVIWRKKNCCHF